MQSPLSDTDDVLTKTKWLLNAFRTQMIPDLIAFVLLPFQLFKWLLFQRGIAKLIGFGAAFFFDLCVPLFVFKAMIIAPVAKCFNSIALIVMTTSVEAKERFTHLIKKGVDLNQQDNSHFNNTVLHFLIANESFSLAHHILLASREYNRLVDLSRLDSLGCNPILLAAKMGNEAFALELIEYAEQTNQPLEWAKPDDRGFNLMDYALLLGLPRLHQKLTGLNVHANLITLKDLQYYSKTLSQQHPERTLNADIIAQLLSDIEINPDRAENAEANTCHLAILYQQQYYLTFSGQYSLLCQKNPENDEYIQSIPARGVKAETATGFRAASRTKAREILTDYYQQLSDQSLLTRLCQSQQALLATLSKPKRRQRLNA